ncbi:MAG: hypothetical protein KDI60_10210, partial [Xanthomonadales bacterium]|nr:hypothetical protein [Xanthomonadales bacterium]
MTGTEESHANNGWHESTHVSNNPQARQGIDLESAAFGGKTNDMRHTTGPRGRDLITQNDDCSTHPRRSPPSRP